MAMGMGMPGMGMGMGLPPPGMMGFAPSAPAPMATAPSLPTAAAFALPYGTKESAQGHALAHAARSEGEVVEQRLYDARLAHFLALSERRAGTELALAYARDANAAVAQVLLALRDDALLLLEDARAPEDDIGLHSLLTLNHVPHTRVSVSSLRDIVLAPRQTLLICGALPSEALADAACTHLSPYSLLCFALM